MDPAQPLPRPPLHTLPFTQPKSDPLRPPRGAIAGFRSHASITGDGIGGSSLTDADLDPTGRGGRGSLHDVPAGAVVIAQNADGPVAVEYGHGDGHILVSALRDPVDACTRNMVLYAGSLVP